MTGEFWNPANPQVAGTEVFPSRQIPLQLTAGPVRGALFTSTVAETIAQIRSYFHARQAGVNGGTVVAGVDVYDADDFLAEVRGALSLPGGNGALTDDWTQCTTGPLTCGPTDSSAYSYVADYADESENVFELFTTFTTFLRVARLTVGATPTPATATFQSDGTYVNVTDGTSSPDPDPTLKRIGWVGVGIVVQNASASPIQLDGIVSVGGNDYTSEGGAQSVQPNEVVRLVFTWKWNPSTGRQWSNADLATFLVGGSGAFGVWVNCAAGVSMDCLIGSVNVIFQALDEKRVTTGYGQMPAGPSLANHFWKAINTLDPMTHIAADWSKATATDYLVVYYLTGLGGVVDLIHVDSANIDTAGHRVRPPDWLGVGVVTFGAVPTVFDPVEDLQIPALYFKRADAAFSVDAQPYVLGRGRGITAGQFASQEISDVGALAYRTVAVAVAAQAGTDADLEVRLRKTSDNSLLAGPISLVAGTDVPKDGRYHVVARRFPAAATLTLGEPVYVEMTTDATTAWLILAAWHREGSESTTAFGVADAASLGIGGTTDAGIYHLVRDTTIDFLASLTTEPAPPAAASVTVPTISQAVTSDPAGPLLIAYALLGWTATSLAGDFLRYEVQRLNPLSGLWEDIAVITTEGSNYFPDVESARNVPVSYRVRVVDIRLAPSAWTTASPATISTPEACSLVLGSNFAPDLTLGYLDEPGHPYKRANSGDLVARLIEGRQRPVAFRPLLEGESDIFTRRLYIAINNPAAIPADRAPFDPLVALVESDDVPAVAVCDGRGRQWWTAPDITGFSFDQPGDDHRADVTFTEIDGPVVLTTDVPWQAGS